eukprot:3517618-Prymnesium_polylepis.2
MSCADVDRPAASAERGGSAARSLLLELASKQYTRRAIEHEQDLRIRRQVDPQAEGEPLSEFGDKKKYAGCVPTGHYFADVLKAFGRMTQAHMDAEVRWWWGALGGTFHGGRGLLVCGATQLSSQGAPPCDAAG